MVGRLIYTVLAVVVTVGWIAGACIREGIEQDAYIEGAARGVAWATWMFIVVMEWIKHRERKRKRKAKKTHMSGHKVVPNWPDPPQRVTHP